MTLSVSGSQLKLPIKEAHEILQLNIGLSEDYQYFVSALIHLLNRNNNDSKQIASSSADVGQLAFGYYHENCM